MIPQATEQFWRKLSELGFITTQLVSQWRQFSEGQDASWSKLCQRIESESILSATHLNQLSSPNGQRIHYGNYLLLRPSYHPLGWETYQVVHAKLQQPFRLIFLPSTEIELPIEDINSKRPSTKIDLLQRAKTIASISSNAIVKVIDIEQFGNQTVIVTQFPEGQLLTSQMIRTDLSPRQWATCIESLANELHLIHRSNVIYGGVDPVMIQVDPQSFRCRLDFLISSPAVGLVDSVPLVLTPQEQSLMIGYRSTKTDWINTCQSTMNFSQANDWQTLGAFLAFVKETYRDSGAYHGLCENLSKTIESIRSCSDFSPTVTTSWVQELQSEQLLSPVESADSTTDNPAIQVITDAANRIAANQNAAAAELNFDNAAKIDQQPTLQASAAAAPAIEADMQVPASLDAKATPKSTSQRRSDANQVNQRRKLTMLIATIAPLPIVLIGFLIYHLASGEAVRLPDKTTAQSGGDLPDATLPDSILPDSTLPDATRPDATRPDATLPDATLPDSSVPDTSLPKTVSLDGDSNDKSANEKDVRPAISNLPTIPLTPKSENEIEQGPTVPNSSSDADTDLVGVTPNPTQSLPKLTDQDEVEMDPTSVDSAASELNLRLPDLTKAKADTTSPKAPDAAPNSDFITFDGIPNAVDIRAKITAAVKDLEASKSEASTITIELGPMNSLTGKATKATWTSPAEGVQLTPSTTPDELGYQTWELTTVDDEKRTVKLGKLRATTDGKLVLDLPIQAMLWFTQLEQSKLLLTYGANELKHEILLTGTSAIAQSSIRTLPKLEFDPRRGSIKTAIWDTPELTDSEAELTLSLSGKPLTKIPSDSADLAALNLRKNEYMYYLGDEPKQGAVMLWVKFLPGKKTRIQAQLHVLSPYQLIPMKLGTALELSEATNIDKAKLKANYDQLKSVRAKSGEGPQKDTRLKQLDLLQESATAFIKSLEFVILNGDSIVNGGLDFQLSAVRDGQSSTIVQSGEPKDEEVAELPDQ